jgi:delta 1-pyrroline-5-carboxylate dehydrogenase
MPAKKRKTVRKKAAHKKKTATKAVKHAARRATKKLPNPRHPRANDGKVTQKAIGLVDKAAALLRDGIRTTSKETESARLASKKRAHSLLSQATDQLHGLISRL